LVPREDPLPRFHAARAEEAIAIEFSVELSFVTKWWYNLVYIDGLDLV
jgi:hypothetical protein